MKKHFWMKLLRYFFVVVLLVLLKGCNSSSETSFNSDLKYFPLKVGNSWTYNVTETTFDTLIQNIVSSYQEKYEITDTYKSQVNEDVYVIHISKRNTSDDDWQVSETWTAKVSNQNEVIVGEENILYVKMILPVHEGVTWKGNKYNTIEAERNNGRIDNFVYINVKKPYNDFPNTITVLESDDKNFAYKDVRYSVYASDVGLVYRVNNYIDYCDDIDCFGMYIRKHEHTKIQTLIDHVVQ
jgi:hypothetical protein